MRVSPHPALHAWQAAEFPPAVAAELQAIEDRLAALEALPEDAWTDGLVSEAEDLQARHDDLVEMTEAEAVYAMVGAAIRSICGPSRPAPRVR